MTKVFCDICKLEIPPLGNIGRITIKQSPESNYVLKDHRSVCSVCYATWKQAVVIPFNRVPCGSCAGWKDEPDKLASMREESIQELDCIEKLLANSGCLQPNERQSSAVRRLLQSLEETERTLSRIMRAAQERFDHLNRVCPDTANAAFPKAP